MGTVNRSITFPIGQTVTGHDAFGRSLNANSSQLLTVSRTRTGVSNPKWHDKIVKRENATTPMTAIYDTVKYRRGNMHVRVQYVGVGEWKTDTFGDVMLKPAIAFNKAPRAPSRPTTVADNRAAQQFYNQIRQLQTQFQGLVFAGELGETLRMIKSPAKALREGMMGYLGALRKRKRADPRHWPRAIGGTWLEHSFGWKPLLSDIRDGYAAYKELTDRTVVKMISAGATTEFDAISDIAAQIGVNKTARFGLGAQDFVRSFDWLKETHKVRYKGCYVAQATATRWQDAKLFGFTPDEFLPSAWELLPWSWLVDYFVNIGDLLNNSVTSTQNVKWVNKTVIRQTRWYGYGVVDKARIAVNVQPNPVVAYGDPGEFECTRKEVTRSAGVGIPRPTLTFGGPGAGQLTNIAALLGQAFSLHPQKPFGKRDRY